MTAIIARAHREWRQSWGGTESAELRQMAARWREQALRTDRDRSCADELEEVLHEANIPQLRMLAVRWHALADLSGGPHRHACELDQWISRHAVRHLH